MSNYKIILENAEYSEGYRAVETYLLEHRINAEIVSSVLNEFFILDEDVKYFYLCGVIVACWDYKIPHDKIRAVFNNMLEENLLLEAVKHLGYEEFMDEILEDVAIEINDIRNKVSKEKKRKKLLPKLLNTLIKEGELYAFFYQEIDKWFYFLCVEDYSTKSGIFSFILISEVVSNELLLEGEVLDSPLVYQTNKNKSTIDLDGEFVPKKYCIFGDRGSGLIDKNLKLLSTFRVVKFNEIFKLQSRKHVLPLSVAGREHLDQIRNIFKFRMDNIDSGRVLHIKNSQKLRIRDLVAERELS